MSMMRRRLLDNTVLKTAEGESMVVRSVARTEPGLSLYGKSHQNTVAGNQLLNPELFQENKYQNHNLGTGNFSIANNTLYWITGKIPVEPSTQYSISKGNLGGAFYADEYTPITTSAISIYSTTFVTPENCHYICVNFDKNGVPFRSNVMMNKGSTLLPYEPYTGGQPSPNPDYPQEIESAGDDGNIGVDVYGGNFLTDVTDKVISGDVGDSVNDVRATWNVVLDKNLLDKELIFSFDSDSNIGRDFLCQINVTVGNSNKWSVETCKQIAKGRNYFSIAKVFDELPEGNVTHIYVQLRINKVPTEELQFTVSNPMLNISSTALPYEPYKQPQSLTVSTPNGLTGIPVSSGGNYTDENGQQWISDEIDFKRGVYVQRVAHYIFDGSEDEVWNIAHYDAVKIDFAHITVNRSINKYETKLLCNMGVGRTWSVIGCCFVNEHDTFIFYHPFISNVFSQGVNAWKSWLQDNPLELYYPLETPIETDLIHEQITAYQSLHTNYPTTTVMNDSDAGMKLTYKTRKSLEVT